MRTTDEAPQSASPLFRGGVGSTPQGAHINNSRRKFSTHPPVAALKGLSSKLKGHDDRSESRTWSLTNNPYLREFSVGRAPDSDRSCGPLSRVSFSHDTPHELLRFHRRSHPIEHDNATSKNVQTRDRLHCTSNKIRPQARSKTRHTRETRQRRE